MSVRIPGKYDEALADTVLVLFSEGNADPSASEIGERHFQGVGAFGDEVVHGIRDRLSTICRVIQESYNIPYVAVSPIYYKKYRRRPPADTEQASECLPRRSNQAAGIRRIQEADDLIYSQYLFRHGRSTTGSASKLMRRITTEIEFNRLTREGAAELLRNQLAILPVEEKQAYSELLKQLEGPSTED